jgi:hypothetical protein
MSISPSKILLDIYNQSENINNIIQIFHDICNKNSLVFTVGIQHDIVNNKFNCTLIYEDICHYYFATQELTIKQVIRKIVTKLNKYLLCEQCDTIVSSTQHICEFETQLSFEYLRGKRHIKNINSICFLLYIKKIENKNNLSAFAVNARDGNKCTCDMYTDTCDNIDDEGNYTCSYTYFLSVSDLSIQGNLEDLLKIFATELNLFKRCTGCMDIYKTKNDSIILCKNCVVQNIITSETNTECSICTEIILKNELMLTKCKHEFHKKCLNKWLESNGNCPLCRLQLPSVQLIS